jgi:hypothetical protein
MQASQHSSRHRIVLALTTTTDGEMSLWLHPVYPEPSPETIALLCSRLRSTRMGMALLMQEPGPFIAKAREVIAEWIANSRSPVSQSLPVNETHAQNGAQQ